MECCALLGYPSFFSFSSLAHFGRKTSTYPRHRTRSIYEWKAEQAFGRRRRPLDTDLILRSPRPSSRLIHLILGRCSTSRFSGDARLPDSRAMLDFQNRQTDKELLILENNASTPFVPTLILSGQTRLSLLAASTNTEDKFSYMGRFPTDFSGNSATDARIV